jgi:zinc-ribbon domain
MQPVGETYPRTAYLLSLVGGILILILSVIYAIVLAVLASLIASVGFGLGASLLVGLAVVSIVFGLIVLYFAMKLKSNPGSAKTYGILIIVFSLISFIGGGGFYIGAILALIGGILALVWTPPAQPVGYGQPPMQAAPGWGQPTMAAAPPAGAGGGKFCASCGSPNAPGAQFCAKCGAPMPP